MALGQGKVFLVGRMVCRMSGSTSKHFMSLDFSSSVLLGQCVGQTGVGSG